MGSNSLETRDQKTNTAYEMGPVLSLASTHRSSPGPFSKFIL